MAAEIEDTYAEAFRSLYVEFMITARERKWLDHAINAATGYGSSRLCAIVKRVWINILVRGVHLELRPPMVVGCNLSAPCSSVSQGPG